MVLTMQQSISAENRQGTKIAWLAGFFDGEGSVGIYKNGNENFYVRMTLTNTDKATLERVQEILEENEIPSYCKWDQQKPTWKPRWQLLWLGSTKPMKLIDLLLPHLVTKKEQVELAKEYIEGRKENRYKNRKGSRWSKDPLTEREQYIIQRIKELKR